MKQSTTYKIMLFCLNEKKLDSNNALDVRLGMH